ncbi:unnamed protein product [Tuber melanosporum]|uniref:(Perigord truffle) hypothetical protein n=1 Tax=Tuber melanosporum (strain Mel28) TaxID=656061 RepID=D5G8K2_TUBMM|nr:uncharacterized protein GSTUM_00002981001 [Tuber melanosporum]CAZ80845.1 unnamed protein product [Tuber melanosporum]
MSSKPIFLATHPRSCSTAFERVMMTREDLRCVHEPFGDAFYFGGERIGERYFGKEHQGVRDKSGFSETTYRDVVSNISGGGEDGKRVFLKDMAYYIIPYDSSAGIGGIAPSLRLGIHEGEGCDTNGRSNDASNESTDGIRDVSPEDNDNPSVIPLSTLKNYHFNFLIRHPRRAIPSFYRCTVPPLSEKTGFDYFLPSEAGYRELRVFFDYLRAKGLIGGKDGAEVCLIDADDLLDHPKEVVQKYCESVGLEFNESMLVWEAGGCSDFDKWKGFHEDAIESKGLRPREKKVFRTAEEEYASWVEKYGEEGARIIEKAVDANLRDYEYLKQFKMNV